MASTILSQPAVRPAHISRAAMPRMTARSAVQALNFHKKITARAASAEAEAATEEAAEAAPSYAAVRLAALEAAEHVVAEETAYALNFLWLSKNIAVGVDQVFAKGSRSPVTEYFFWPRKDAWEELKASLEGKTWIGEREKVLLLNRCTEVINYWQDENKHSAEEAAAKFTDCKFQGQ